jgi:polyhydroxyalkanoate synthase
VAAFSAAAYLLNARTLMGLADAVEADAKTKARIRFAVEQWMAASSPSNFLALNAEAQKKAIETKGESIAKGVQNLLHDMRQGHVSMTDESVFEVGKNVATTEGAVVFENELFQLIEYKPLTAKVYERPFLLVPPCINKFYILDLQPDNSLIRYAVEQGHRTFVVSWRNPDESLAQTTWDDYIEQGRHQGHRRGAGHHRRQQINALGFCVGGTILGTALAVLAAPWREAGGVGHLPHHLPGLFRHRRAGPVHRRSLRQVPRDAARQGRHPQGAGPGHHLQLPAAQRPGVELRGGQLPQGRNPAPFDLLYWNSDSTNLPGPMYAWYLRNTYFENNLVKPGKCTVAGEKVDLRKLDMPVYIYGSPRRPHRAHWRRLRVHQAPAGQEAFCDGCLGPHRRRDQPARCQKAQPLGAQRRQVPQDAGRMAQAGAKEHPAAGGPTGPTGSRATAGKQIAAPKAYGKGKVQGHRARAWPLCQGQGLNTPPNNLEKKMEDIVIVSAARTAVGKFGGSLAKIPGHRAGRDRHQGSHRPRQAGPGAGRRGHHGPGAGRGRRPEPGAPGAR